VAEIQMHEKVKLLQELMEGSEVIFALIWSTCNTLHQPLNIKAYYMNSWKCLKNHMNNPVYRP
jgi:hypothetical protein